MFRRPISLKLCNRKGFTHSVGTYLDDVPSKVPNYLLSALEGILYHSPAPRYLH